MITITYKGKTYKPTDAWNFSVLAIVNDLIEKGCLEEVKENKDSILEKLREAIENEIDQVEDSMPCYGDYRKLLRILTSPENKERTPEEIMDLVHKRPHPTLSVTVTPAEYEDMKKQYEESWTPTPGQMIEVSEDGIDWIKGKFVRMNGKYYQVKNTTWDFPSLHSDWLNARPITEEVIDHDLVKENIRVMDEQDGYSEVIVPEYTAPQMYADGGRHKVGGPTAEQKQLEAITQWIHSQSNK